MFEAEGKNLAGLLNQASLALFEVVCQIKKVKPKKAIQLKLEAKNESELVHNWLDLLLSESDANEMFFSKFSIKVTKGKKLTATGKASGEPYSRAKSGTVVKGVTYYKFKVRKTKNGYKAIVVIDI